MRFKEQRILETCSAETRSQKKKFRKDKLFEFQDGRCFWCQEKMFLGKNNPNSATIDHLVPRSKGGRNFESNYVIACHECNVSRGARSAIKWALISGR